MNPGLLRMRTVTGIFPLILLLAFSVAWSGCFTEKEDPVAAEVAGEEILKKEVVGRADEIIERNPKLYKAKSGPRSKEGLRRQILNSMINDLLLEKEAVKRGLKLDEEALRKKAEETVAKLPEAIREEQGMTVPQLELSLRKQAVIDFLTGQYREEASVRDEEVESYFQNNPAQFTGRKLEQVEAEIREIIIKRKAFEKVQELLARLKEKQEVKINK